MMISKRAMQSFPAFGGGGAPVEYTRATMPEDLRLGRATACRFWTMVLAGDGRLEIFEARSKPPRSYVLEPGKSRLIRSGVEYRVEILDGEHFFIAWFRSLSMTRGAASRKPHPAALGLLVGIGEDLIRRIVVAFYARVRVDPILGPVFDEAIHDWPAHLERMCDFWSSVLLITGAYKGGVLEAHAGLAALELQHFARWLELFDRTAGELGGPTQASVFSARALKIARRIQSGGAKVASPAPCPACQPLAAA